MPRPEKIIINLKTITPIWTGGINRNKMEYIKGSSIIGGLRFWAEAYFRALGEYVCDITGDNKCIYDKDKGKKNICKVCELLGCTGKSRQFLLKVVENSMKEKKGVKIALPECKYKNQYGKVITPRWFLKNGKIGDSNQIALKVQLVSLHEGKIDPIILYLLKIMINWGTLGAQDQYGYGVVETMNNSSLSFSKDLFESLPETPISSDRPALSDFFFFIARAKHDKLKQYNDKLPFLIRCKVRADFRKHTKSKGLSPLLRHYFCGSMKSDKNATKYNIALTPDGILRGWGWFPGKGQFAEKRNICLKILKDKIKEHSKELKWKEFNSKRDNVNSAQKWPDFLQELNETKLTDLSDRKK